MSDKIVELYQSQIDEMISNAREETIDECKEKIRIAFIDVMRSYEGVIYPAKWIDDVLDKLKENNDKAE